MTTSDETTNPKKNKWTIPLGIIILLLLLWNGYYFLIKKASDEKKQEQELVEAQNKLDDLKKEKQLLDETFQSFKIRYDSLLIENDSMAITIYQQVEELSQSKRKIDKLYAKLNQLKSDHIQNNINEEALAEYSKERNRFLAQIDQLGKSNQMLKIEVDNLKMKLGETGGEVTQSLTGDIMANTISFKGIYEKKGVDVETSKSKKVKKFKVGFYLNKNDKINAGAKVLYVRIMDKNGKIISPTGGTIIKRIGNKVEYSIEREIDYPSDEAFVYFITPIDPLVKGMYTVEIYTSESLAGSKSMMLK